MVLFGSRVHGKTGLPGLAESGRRVNSSRMADLTDDIEELAANPKKIWTDGLLVEEHSLKDQIAADKYLRQQGASTDSAAGKLPIQLFKIKPPGSV